MASCRAVLFTSFVDDPGEEGVPPALLQKMDELPAPDPLPPDWGKWDQVEQRRARLFAFIEHLVKWESTTDERLMGVARDLIYAATEGNPPPVLDPFCGGGSIPLEAQRLGLRVYASDLNPVAGLITKALVEIPPKFSGRPPVNPADRAKMGSGAAWKGAAGLAADVRHYGAWMRERASERIGHLYSKGPNGETVIAWLWARTVKCPNPACGGQMPIARSFVLSSKAGRQAFVAPNVDRTAKVVRFAIKTGELAASAESGTKVGPSSFSCVFCGSIADGKFIAAEGMHGRMGAAPMALVAEGKRGRAYLAVEDEATARLTDQEQLSIEDAKTRYLSGSTPERLTGGTCYAYGFTTWGSLFTPRQLVALTTFSDLVGEARALALDHAKTAGMGEGLGLADGGGGADAYADAVATYLAIAIDKLSTRTSSLSFWDSGGGMVQQLFARQALPMVWDFAEANPLSDSTGSWEGAVDGVVSVMERAVPGSAVRATVDQLDAAIASPDGSNPAVCTDPPYYDNIGYADLSDFFYVWLRRTLRSVYPTLFSTLLTPKAPELVATPYRFGGSRSAAEAHFESGIARAFKIIRGRVPDGQPVTLYYAFKQSEARAGTGKNVVVASTGWEKMLTGLLAQGFVITATWPMRTEYATHLKNVANALASSVVLACRPRPHDAPLATLREFTTALNAEMPRALRHMTGGHIAPVDLRQAAIGPGMSVFSRYGRVLEPDGSPMTVRRALELINASVDSYLSEVASSLDRDTQFCVAWFDQFRFGEGPFGRAEDLVRAINVAVDALARAGLLTAERGRVQLRTPKEYAQDAPGYDPAGDPRPSAWKACHYLIGALETGEEAAGRLLRRLGGLGDNALELAYQLYAICERRGGAGGGPAVQYTGGLLARHP